MVVYEEAEKARSCKTRPSCPRKGHRDQKQTGGRQFIHPQKTPGPGSESCIQENGNISDAVGCCLQAPEKDLGCAQSFPG
jgi:hypothetical protein